MDEGVPVGIFQRIQCVYLLIGWIGAVEDKRSQE